MMASCNPAIVSYCMIVLIAAANIYAKHDYSKIFKNVKSDTTASKQTEAALAVISRTLPAHQSEHFIVEIDFQLPRNTFHLKKNDSDEFVLIKASSGVAACKGFNHYLKYYCNAHISWEDEQLASIPERLPTVNVTETSPSYFIYYQNVCTWSYSFVWWQWAEWQRHIDWMAMNGISLTLAPVQELVWSDVYAELGLTSDEIDDHLAGPAFMAWQRMGNMRGWGGPLTEAFKKSSSLLQKRVIEAQRDLGMAVALPAFAGHVPVAVARLFPNATFTPATKWNRFPNEYCCPLYIDPVDPLFTEIGQMFLRRIIDVYGGSNHIYFSDPFNELQPRSSDAIYLANASKGIYETMASVDPDAVWLLQGWMFVKNPFWSDELLKAFVTAVPQGRMLVLDLQSENSPQYMRTQSYYGQPFIWCMLHNFGGTLGMHGSVEVVNTAIVEAYKMPNSTMYGVGITPEGINQNYVMYEFALERGWDHTTVDAEKWFDQYAFTRYGESDEFVKSAWDKLRTSVYAFNDTEPVRGKYIVCRRPSFKLTPAVWYNFTIIERVWSDLLSASEEVRSSVLYKHDLVDVTRQYLQNKIEALYPQLTNAFRANDKIIFLELTGQFIEAMLDMDRILATNSDFLLGRWLKQAKAMAASDGEAELFEINARNQITIWGPSGQIVDYAMKQWAGVVKDYCMPRWRLFFDTCLNALNEHKNFNANKFRDRVFKDVEHPWTVANDEYAIQGTGHTIGVSKELYGKWIGRDLSGTKPSGATIRRYLYYESLAPVVKAIRTMSQAFFIRS